MRPLRYHPVSFLRAPIPRSRTFGSRAVGLSILLFPLALPGVGCGPDCAHPWYADLDGDGYGDRASMVEACEAPEAYVANARDCDDHESSIHPGAIEACNEIDDDCDGVVDGEARTWYLDRDRDGYGDPNLAIDACSAPEGYVERSGDCDDANGDTWPGSPLELCDGKDNDCDELIDEGAEGTILWYPDNDLDGWGNSGEGRRYCAPPAGWVTRAGDCDDSRSERSPDRIEVCNGIDDDCDFAPDEADPQGVDGMVLAYPDGDHDGYGDARAFPSTYCFVPYGYAENASDCDDGRPLVHPGGTEICNGGIDDDCDGAIDDADGSLDLSTAVEGWADGDGDGYGDLLAPSIACSLGQGVVGNTLDCDDGDRHIGPDLWLPDSDGDGGGAGTPIEGEGCAPIGPGLVNVLSPLDCDDSDETIREGLPDPCGDGVDSDCSGLDPACGLALDAILPLESAARGFAHGALATDAYDAVAAGMDLDGDGLGDAVLGAAAGGAELLILSGPGPERLGPWVPSARVPSDGAGALALVPDVTGDGRAELVVGSPERFGGDGAIVLLSAPDYNVRMEVWGPLGGELGAALASVGDLDGDTVPELLVGAPGIDAAGLFSLDTIDEQSYDSALLVLTGTGSLGAAVACCSDLDGDGGGELVLGAPGEGGAGAVYAVDGAQRTAFGFPVPAAEVALGRFLGATGADFGAAVAAGADFDGDGRPDLVVSAPSDATRGADAGAVYVLTVPTALGPDTGGGGSESADDLAAYIVRGALPGLSLARSVALADLDGDGLGDLVLGADAADLGGTDSGAVYVFYGDAAGSVDTDDADGVLFGTAGSGTGRALAVGPIDADPTPELWIAQPGLPGGGAWLIPGP